MSVPSDLRDFYNLICQARGPEEIFGDLNGGDPRESLKRAYHAKSFACHPNFYATDPEAELYAKQTFQDLYILFEDALKKLENGTYGKPDAPSSTNILFKLTTRKQTYNVYRHLVKGDCADIYYAEAIDSAGVLLDKVCLKVITDPEDNPLLLNEMRILEAVKHKSLPVYLDRFRTKDKQEALILRHIDGLDFVSLKSRFPGGFPQYHLCWVMERCLSALGFLHYNAVLHCNLEPGNLMVRLGSHGGFILDFLFAVHNPTEKSKFQIHTDLFSPPESLQKKPPIPQSDLYSLGKCFLFLAGGNLDNNWLPDSIDRRIREFIMSFLDEDPMKRRDDAWAAYHELTALRKAIFGPNHTFVEITLPSNGSN
jgi:serine/threonine protein kinase